MKQFKEFINVQGVTQLVTVNDKVRYIPRHAEADRNHKDCETGIVTSLTNKFCFVRYEKQHPESNGQATSYDDIEVI